MDVYEKYYRRSYNAINRLIEVYKNGYNRENTLKYCLCVSAVFILSYIKDRIWL